jgi:hypothetical protein
MALAYKPLYCDARCGAQIMSTSRPAWATRGMLGATAARFGFVLPAWEPHCPHQLQRCQDERSVHLQQLNLNSIHGGTCSLQTSPHACMWHAIGAGALTLSSSRDSFPRYQRADAVIGSTSATMPASPPRTAAEIWAISSGKSRSRSPRMPHFE